MLREHGLDDGADSVHQSGAKDPTEGNGELERALSSRGVGPLFLWDPDAEIFIGAENLDA